MRCEHCKYKWVSKVKTPKACPRCKRRFDYPYKEILRDIEEKGLRENV